MEVNDFHWHQTVVLSLTAICIFTHHHCDQDVVVMFIQPRITLQ